LPKAEDRAGHTAAPEVPSSASAGSTPAGCKFRQSAKHSPAACPVTATDGGTCRFRRMASLKAEVVRETRKVQPAHRLAIPFCHMIAPACFVVSVVFRLNEHPINAIQSESNLQPNSLRSPMGWSVSVGEG